MVILLIGILIGLVILTVWLWIRIQSLSRSNIADIDARSIGSAIAQNGSNSRDKKTIGSSQRVTSDIMVDTPYGRMVRSILSPIDQHSCNACWAISTCQTVSDRLHLEGKIPRDQLNYYAFHDIIVSQTPTIDGCDSGILLDVGLDMFIREGAPLMSQSLDRNFNDQAIKSDLTQKRYKVQDWNSLTVKDRNGTNIPATIDLIKQELNTNGPVVGVINLYDSFNFFEGSGVYTPDVQESTDSSMAHMISIVGYDNRDNTWIIRNSYGTSFGHDGYVKIQQGDKRINVENYVYAPVI